MFIHHSLALALLLTVSTVMGADKSAWAGVADLKPTVQVVAYYFHKTIRCEMCLAVEKQAREAIERRFPKELAAKRLVFKPLNYDEPENVHFLVDYKLQCPSLVLVRQQGGKDKKWKLLDKTWEHIVDPAKFNSYVESEVRKMLRDAK